MPFLKIQLYEFQTHFNRNINTGILRIESTNCCQEWVGVIFKCHWDKKKKEQSADVLGKSHKVNLAKMAENVVQISWNGTESNRCQ